MNLTDIRRLLHRCAALLALGAATAVAPACERIYESEGDCAIAYRVEFIFTRNILQVDAIAARVNSLSLFIFDKQGNLVVTKSEVGDNLADSQHSFVITEEEIAPGYYDLIAWGGLDGNNSFSLAGGDAPRTKQDLICRMERLRDEQNNAYSNQPLAPLFYGEDPNIYFPDNTYGQTTITSTINLTKDTNTVRVVLQYHDGHEIDMDDFSFTITDANGLLNYDNAILSDEEITYYEHTKTNTTIPIPGTAIARADDESGPGINSVVAEIDVSRLVKDDLRKPRLAVYTSDRVRPIIDIDLIALLLQANTESGGKLHDQMYLDYQDDYNLIFFLTDEKDWHISGGIWVNSWHVIYQKPSL